MWTVQILIAVGFSLTKATLINTFFKARQIQ